MPEHIEAVLTGQKGDVNKTLLQQDPEQFVNQFLVWPVLESLGYDYIIEWYHSGHGGSVDFLLRNTEFPVLGECKRLNRYKHAVKDLREYLNHRTAQTSFGVATDGINWLLIREPGDLRKNPEIMRYHSLRGAMFDYLASKGEVQPQLEGERVLWNSSVGKIAKAPYQEYGRLRRVSLSKSVDDFVEKFAPTNVSESPTSHEYDRTLPENPSPADENRTLDDFG